MLRKFLDGLLFGAGFGLSLIVITVIFLQFFSTHVVHTSEASFVTPNRPGMKNENTGSSIPPEAFKYALQPELFYELPIEERIEKSSVIALARYEQAPDGRVKAIIKEFLKKDPDTTLYYDIGDEYTNASYYPKEDTRYGDGVIIFFTGSPAMMRMSMTYDGDRIHSLADMPIELLRQKCAPDAADS